MDSVMVSSCPPSSNSETKKRKRDKKKHGAVDQGGNNGDTHNRPTETPLVNDVVLAQGSHQAPAVNNNTEESVLVETQTKLSRGKKNRLRKKRQRMKENADPNLSSPSAEAPLQGVEPAVGNNSLEPALIKPVTGLSRSQKKRVARKRRKQKIMQGNSKSRGLSNGNCLTMEAPADVSLAKDVVGVSFNKGLSTSAEDGKNKKTKKKKKLDRDGNSLPLEAPAVISIATDLTGVPLDKELSTSAEDGKKRKTKKKKKHDCDGDSLALEALDDVSLASNLAGVPLDRDLSTSADDGDKKKTKKKRKVDPDDSSLLLEAPADVSVTADMSGASLEKDLSTSAEKEKRKKTKKKKKLDPADDTSLTIEVPADVSVTSDMAGTFLREDLSTIAEGGKKKKTKKRKPDPDGSSLIVEAPTDVSIAPELPLDKDLSTSAEKGTKKKAKKDKRKFDRDGSSPTIESLADVSIVATDKTGVHLDNDLSTSGEQGKRKKNKKDKRNLDRYDNLINVHADVSMAKDVAEIVPSSSQLKVTEENVDLDATPKGDRLLSPERALSSAPPKKKLLILDINGILVDIPQGSTKRLKPDFRISGKAAFKRPHCDDFLRFIFERFNVGVWSSRTKWNLQKAVDELMRGFTRRLLFEWDRSRCTKTKLATLENKNKPIVLKELKKLWEKCDPCLPWNKGDFNETNTLLVDDSPYKALRNPAHTAIFPYPYEYENKEDAFLAPGSEFRVYLEKIAETDNVQKFVEQNPFGQPAITETHPSWDFYLQVIDCTEPSAIHGGQNSKLPVAI